jgi:3-phenylpropionate/trans-cinnamate dioxygenase ferredoxin component
MCGRPISVGDPPRSLGSRWTAICPVSRLVEQSVVCTSIGGNDLMLIWSGSRALACERACPHEQADLSHGRLSNGRLFCPRHAASFDLGDGSITAGWPSRPLRIYPVRIAEELVWIDAEAVAFDRD